MNFKIIKTSLAIIAIMVLCIIGCKKDKTVTQPTGSGNTDQPVELSILTDETNASYLDSTSLGGDENLSFYVVNDGLAEAYIIEDADFSGSLRVDDNHIIHCIKECHISDSQEIRIKHSLSNYVACKASSVEKHHNDYKELSTKTENSRKELNNKLKNGTITKSQWEKSMKEVKTHFEHGLSEIKSKYANSLKECYEKFLHSLKETLTEKQWILFSRCIKK